MTPAQFAAAHGLDPKIVECLLQFLITNIVENDKVRERFLAATESQRLAIIGEGVRHYFDHSREWLEELLEAKTERALFAREQLMVQVYEQLKGGAA